jgi:hypothetical protein
MLSSQVTLQLNQVLSMLHLLGAARGEVSAGGSPGRSGRDGALEQAHDLIAEVLNVVTAA